MHNLIRTLRRKPKQVRDLYAFLIAFLVTGIIAGVWATSLPARFSSQARIEAQNGKDAGSWRRSFEFLRQDIAQFSSTIRSINEKPEYSKDDHTVNAEVPEDAPHMIDLNALVASSSGNSTSVVEAVMIGTTSKNGAVH